MSPSTVTQASRNRVQSALDSDSSPLSEDANPFITTTAPTTPAALQYPIVSSFSAHQDQHSSPAMGSPTPTNPRPLRRRDAASFIAGEVGRPISEIKQEILDLLSSGGMLPELFLSFQESHILMLTVGFSPTPSAGAATEPSGRIRPFRVGGKIHSL